jgi:hypothetical protein
VSLDVVPGVIVIELWGIALWGIELWGIKFEVMSTIHPGPEVEICILYLSRSIEIFHSPTLHSSLIRLRFQRQSHSTMGKAGALDNVQGKTLYRLMSAACGSAFMLYGWDAGKPYKSCCSFSHLV